MASITIRDVKKSYAKSPVVHGVDLDIVELDDAKTLHAPMRGESSTQSHQAHHRNACRVRIIAMSNFTHQAVEVTVRSKGVNRSACQQQKCN